MVYSVFFAKKPILSDSANTFPMINYQNSRESSEYYPPPSFLIDIYYISPGVKFFVLFC